MEDVLLYDVIIIGAGPAGLTAAIYAGRSGLKTLILENKYPGGQIVITDSIENYPGVVEPISGYELISKFQDQAKRFGAEINVEFIEKFELIELNAYKIYTQHAIYQCKAIIFCNGASPKNLDIKGENEFTGRGVSYCATCDAPFFRDRNVMVIGGGNTALEEALYLTKFAKKVTIVHRRSRFRADFKVTDEAQRNSKINFILDSEPLEIKGDSAVRSIYLKNLLSMEITEHQVDGIFIFIGYQANSVDIPEIIALTEDGYIIVDKQQQTNIPGIFAAGDICDKYFKQVVTACSDGATAAHAALRYIDKY